MLTLPEVFLLVTALVTGTIILFWVRVCSRLRRAMDRARQNVAGRSQFDLDNELESALRRIAQTPDSPWTATGEMGDTWATAVAIHMELERRLGRPISPGTAVRELTELSQPLRDRAVAG